MTFENWFAQQSVSFQTEYFLNTSDIMQGLYNQVTKLISSLHITTDWATACNTDAFHTFISGYFQNVHNVAIKRECVVGHFFSCSGLGSQRNAIIQRACFEWLDTHNQIEPNDVQARHDLLEIAKIESQTNSGLAKDIRSIVCACIQNRKRKRQREERKCTICNNKAAAIKCIINACATCCQRQIHNLASCYRHS